MYDKINFDNKIYDLLTIGELLIDMISNEFSEKFSCNSYIRKFGGSPSNIAINAKKLGVNSLPISCVGNDGFGDFLISSLEKENVDTSQIIRSKSPTSMVVLTRSKETPIPIFYRGADYQIKYTPTLDEKIKNSKIVHFSSWPISKKQSREVIERVIKTAKESSTLIGFDPNYHKDLWEEENGTSLMKSMIKYTDFIKPSEDDAERLFGKDNPENQIKKFFDLGAKLVVMTLGKDGVIVSDGVNSEKFDTLATNVVDVTGAGDAFWAGFYVGLIKGRNVIDSVKVGLAASAFKLRYVGAISPMPRYEELIKEFII
ncbi:carbohydrate kinase family protein [Caloramator quimbayensis]|nr:carbohydrate kinase [Caloramator quimbayensis]